MKSPKRPQNLTNFARKNRVQMTPAERLLWAKLRSSPGGIRFRRQHPVGGFILDFTCAAAMLGIELDGDSHEGKFESDASRDAKLASMGWKVVRMPNAQVLSEAHETAEWLVKMCQDRIEN
jgi:very-short-patch-repair endonuclease